MVAKERDTKLLKFPEFQGIVIRALKRYIYEHDSSYTKIAIMTDLSKSRFSEMKKVGKDSGGREYYIYPLSQSVLEPLLGRGIVQLEAIEKHVDTSDPKKEQWLEDQKMFKDVRDLRSIGYPIKEKILEMKKEAGLE